LACVQLNSHRGSKLHSLLRLALLDLLKESAVLVHSHVAGASTSALATLRRRGRLGANGLLALGLLATLLGATHKGSNSGVGLGDGLAGGLLYDLLAALGLNGGGVSTRFALLATEADNLGVSFLELPLTAGVGKNTLADLALAARDGSHVVLAASGSSDDLGVTEGLDGGLELVVTVEVGGVAGRMELLLKLGLEGVDDEAALNTSVGGEDLGGVDAAELKRPLGHNDDLVLEVEDVDLREFALVLGEGGLGEVGGHVEEGVRDEEVGPSLLDEDLKILAEELLGESVVISPVLDHLGVKGLESGC